MRLILCVKLLCRSSSLDRAVRSARGALLFFVVQFALHEKSRALQQEAGHGSALEQAVKPDREWTRHREATLEASGTAYTCQVIKVLKDKSKRREEHAQGAGSRG